MPELFCVYDLIEDGVVVYVGLSLKPTRRLKDHKRAGKCRSNATVREVCWYDLRAGREAEERRIQELRPRGNTIFNVMPKEQARKIWCSHLRSWTNADAVARMPGWSVDMARSHFGPRMHKLKEYAYLSARNYV